MAALEALRGADEEGLAHRPCRRRRPIEVKPVRQAGAGEEVPGQGARRQGTSRQAGRERTAKSA